MKFSIVAALALLALSPVVATPKNDAGSTGPLPWIRDGKLTNAATVLIGEMRDAEKYGLRPQDYGAAALAARAQSLASARDTAMAANALDADISTAVARFVTEIHAGRIVPHDVGVDLDVPHAKIDTREAIRRLSSSAMPLVVLSEYEPPFRHYRLLREALARYRILAAEPQPPPLATPGRRSIRPGDDYAHAHELRERLAQLGDLALPAAANDDATLDALTTMALIRFQIRHRLVADGAVNAATIDALNVPLAQRVRQIEFAIERLRWLPTPLSSPPIIVNIPQFQLFAFRSTDDLESDLLVMNVVVGKAFPKYSTPVFAADLRQVVFSPYWDVPRSILLEELLPQMRRSADWVERNDFEIVRGQGDDAAPVAQSAASIAGLESGALRLRQKPGPRNALGGVKFVFPNRYNVYLHDTPTQGTFSQVSRAASHGCIRVADPMALARYVLGNDPSWDDAKIAAAMNADAPTRVALARPIRVFVVYATALAVEDGRVLFFEDIYHHDEKLARVWDGAPEAN